MARRGKTARRGKITCCGCDFWIWVARIDGGYYVYCKVKEGDGRYKTYYMAPLEDLLRKLGIPAETAREMKRIKELVDDIEAWIKREAPKINAVMAAMWRFVKDMEELARQRSDLYVYSKLFELHQALVDALGLTAQQYQ